ncbi:MAG: nucleotidyltransferase family protein, partial [Geminicoccaceae bacterium]
MNQPAGDERLLLRAALLDTEGPDAWRSYLALHPGIDHLNGDGFALLPMVFSNLSGTAPPAPEMGRLRGIYRRTWYANQMLLHAASQAVAALDAARVDVMLVGGCGLVALHGDAGLRLLATVDLAVAAGDRSRSLRVLAGLGWGRPTGSAARRLHDWPHVRLVRAGRETLVLRCIVPRLDRAGTEERMAAGTGTVGGVAIPIPSATDQLLVACVGRRRTPPRPPLRWIPEAALVIRADGARIDRSRLWARARARGAAAELGEALRLLASDYGLELSGRRLMRPPAGPSAELRTATRLDVDRVEAFRHLALHSAFATLVQTLRIRGIRPVLIKGPAIAQWLYDDPRERPYGDIDLLIEPDQFALAEQVMAEHGFMPDAEGFRGSERSEHHERWIRPGAQEVKIELHRTLA